MSRINPLFSYMTVLAVIQPARIQDIERAAERYFSPETVSALIEGRLLREAHKIAREQGLVVQVRRGVYFTAANARTFVRRAGLEQSIDNRRLFLMKTQRRRYK